MIKNEQWSVKHLMSKIQNKEIFKPKFQRKRKWDILPTKENTPSEKNYILFLEKEHNSVHPITFGQIGDKFSNIDGNNRINAISHFLQEPFCLFPERLNDIFTFIDATFENKDVQQRIKDIIKRFNYNDIVTFKYNTYFEAIGEKQFYIEHLKQKRDEFECEFEKLARAFKINNEDRFDYIVKINVNLFEGYTTDELCETFEDINKYNSKLTEVELLACRLYNVNDFEITEPIMKAAIVDNLKEFYMNRKENEVLPCYEHDEKEDKLNAYDFMIGFQKYCSKQCKMIHEAESDSLPLFFKLYRILYKDKGSIDTSFTTDHINQFIGLINQTIVILKKIYSTIFMEKLVGSSKIMDACNKKIDTLKARQIYIIIVAIIGYIHKGEEETTMLRSIEKCILFHFFVNDINNKETRERQRLYDVLPYESGAKQFETVIEKTYKTPSLICDKIKKEHMNEVLAILVKENCKDKVFDIRPNGKDKVDKRRSRKFFEKALLYYFYKNKIPTHFLKYNYWIEHICPFSCSWEDEIDIDRLGNIIPIIDELNGKRGNKHISEYKKNDRLKFMDYMKDIIPTEDMYNQIVSHQGKKPHIAHSDQFTMMCERNEQTLINTFVDLLF